MAQIRLLRGFLTVGGWTLASRVLGFVRDVAIAGMLGTGPVAQAFVVAFSLPNMFRRFFAEGAFNMAFVPIFAKKLEAGDDPAGFARRAASGLAGVLVVLVVLAHLAMPWLVLAMASGFAGDERLALATVFGRIAFPYILLISLAALLSGVLNAAGRLGWRYRGRCRWRGWRNWRWSGRPRGRQASRCGLSGHAWTAICAGLLWLRPRPCWQVAWCR